MRREWRNRIVRSGEMAASEFVPHELNARRHPRSQRDALVGSLDSVGIVARVIRSARSGKLLDGHARIEEAIARNPKQLIPFDEVDVSVEEERTILATFDPITGLATYDPQSLDALLDGLVTGSDALDELVKELAENNRALPEPGGGGDEFDTTPAQGEAITRRGDVYVINGKHRVMCGDATSVEDVASLMDEKIAAVCLTDPPYGINLEYQSFDDSLREVRELALKWFPLARSVSDVTVFSCGVTRQWLYPEPDWVLCWFYGGGQFRSPWGFNCWQPFLAYGDDPSLAIGKGCRPDSIDMNTPANAAELNHPCPKPLALWIWFIQRLSFKESDLLFDPFIGSGTTLIAAHRENRTCYGMEIDPHYCDVIVRRAEAEGMQVEKA